MLSLKGLLPDRFLQAFPRSALDTLLTIATMPKKGAAITWDPDTISVPEIKQYWNAGHLSRGEVSRALDMVVDRVYGKGTEGEKARLPLDLKSLELAMKEEPSTSDVTGGYRHYVLARISHFVLKVDAASWVTSVMDRATAAASSGSRLVSTLLFPVASLADVAVPQMMHYYTLFLHALGFENILGVGIFVNRIYYDTVYKLGYNSLFALELFIVYIKALDFSGSLTMTSIWDSGSQDTYLTTAKSEFSRRWGDSAAFFRTHGGNPSDGPCLPCDPSASGGDPSATTSTKKYNGKFNTNSDARACTFFNTHTDHPKSALRADGTCRLAHVCDHFVTDKGPSGRCRSSKHTRDKCDNPAKGPKQE